MKVGEVALQCRNARLILGAAKSGCHISIDQQQADIIGDIVEVVDELSMIWIWCCSLFGVSAAASIDREYVESSAFRLALLPS